jgi:cyclohexyl-isocyanide hydratase
MSETTRLRSGLLVFPDMTQFDLTGPYEVLARLPGAETLLLWKNLEPVRSEHGLTILPMATLETSPPFDLILVPGGAGINPLVEDAEVLAFLRRAAAEARFVVGVCTGSLVLGAAGLLRGRRATTH